MNSDNTELRFYRGYEIFVDEDGFFAISGNLFDQFRSMIEVEDFINNAERSETYHEPQ